MERNGMLLASWLTLWLVAGAAEAQQFRTPDAPRFQTAAVSRFQTHGLARLPAVAADGGLHDGPPVVPASAELARLPAKGDANWLPGAVSMAGGDFHLAITGAVTADLLFATRRTFPTGAPLFLLPGSVFGFDQDSFAVHARASTLTGVLSGPRIGSFDTGGQFTVFFFSETLVEDRNGILPFQAFGQLRNERWRLAAGLQRDIFAPGNPTMLVFTKLFASGNPGSFRGQLRVERFWHPSPLAQVTLTAGLSDPVTRVINDTLQITEDNGWPNVEGRLAFALGPLEGSGRAAARPLEIGVSGVVGQMRNTPVSPPQRVVADIWGVSADFRWGITRCFGVKGEFFTGQTLGRYNAGIQQDFNSQTFQGVRTNGGWGEVYLYLTPELHTHAGYGIDDPIDRDLASLQRLRNETYFANLIWDVTSHFRMGIEYTYRKTAYTGLPNNQGHGVHTQFQWRF